MHLNLNMPKELKKEKIQPEEQLFVANLQRCFGVTISIRSL